MKQSPIPVLSLCALLSLAATRVHADPAPPTPPTTPAVNNAPHVDLPPELLKQLAPLFTKRSGDNKVQGKSIGIVTLDYDKATQNSAEVLGSKVSVTFKDASFLSALDAVMDASAKTCRIECRQLHPLRLSMHVQSMPVSGLLDSLAKLSGARLWVLPTKLLIAPEKALTADEKKSAKPYGVLLTATTLPATPGAEELKKTNSTNKNILDVANTKISGDFNNRPIGLLIQGELALDPKINGHFGTTSFSGIPLTDWTTGVSVSFQDVNLGDALASLAHLLGFELYLTPKCFVIGAPTDLSSSPTSQFNTQNTVPAFAPSSTTFLDPSAKGS